MNKANQNIAGAANSSNPLSAVIKVAASSLLAGTFLCSASPAAEPTPADDSVSFADPTPVVSAPATQPAVVPPTAQEPTPSEPRVLEPKTSAPATTVAPTATAPTAKSASGGDAVMISKGLTGANTLSLTVNKSAVLATNVPYKRVSIAQPDIADINLVGTSEILVMGKHPGSTQLVVWDDQDRSQVVDIRVGFDLHGLDEQLKEMFPKASIKADVVNGTIVLRGRVPDLITAQKAILVATPYGSNPANPVLNFMEVSGGQQVVLHVRFAEVQRSVKQQLGFNAFVTDGKFAVGAGNGPSGLPPTLANVPTNASVPLYGGALAGNASFEYFITALRTNGLLRDLAEPNLVAISGQEASFLAGGEIPIPVPQPGGGSTGITIDYKKYGITLKFTPIVLGDGRVRLHCAPEVSTLDYSNAVQIGGSPVPALVTRNVDTTVELAEGQTFALAGLLDDRITASNSITPLLGDLPVLGALFRSVSYQHQNTELVVLVTPHLVEGIDPNQVPSLPGVPWRDPSEAQLFLNGDLGGPAPDKRHAPEARTSQFYGTAGYAPLPAPGK